MFLIIYFFLLVTWTLRGYAVGGFCSLFFLVCFGAGSSGLSLLARLARVRLGALWVWCGSWLLFVWVCCCAVSVLCGVFGPVLRCAPVVLFSV